MLAAVEELGLRVIIGKGAHSEMYFFRSALIQRRAMCQCQGIKH